MEEVLIETYVKKKIKYCSGCLHTEDVTKLSNMQSYGWVFTYLFTKIYLMDDLQSSFICSWCIRRLENARKLFENIQNAQRILQRIGDINSPKSKHEIANFMYEIDDVKYKSRLDFNVLELCDYNSTSSDHIFETEIKQEKLEFDIPGHDINDFQFESDIETENDNQYSSLICETEIKSNYNLRNSVKLQNDILAPKILRTHKDISLRENRMKPEETEANLKQDMDLIREKNVQNGSTITSLSVVNDPCFNQEVTIRETVESRQIDQRTSNSKRKKRKKTHIYLPHIVRIPCEDCDQTFIKGIALENHIFRKHRRKFSCNLCDKRFITNRSLELHTDKTHEVGLGTFECDICGAMYKMRRRMVQHMKKHEKFGPKIRPLQIKVESICHRCGKVVSRANMKTHQLTHSEERNYKCTICKRGYKTASALATHSRRHMDPEVGRRYPCSICTKRFMTPQECRNHMNTMHLCQGLPCAICDKRFANKYKLTCHVTRVHEKVPFVKDKQCDLCNVAFSNNRLLRQHRYTHTGEKPYKCDLCTSAYTQRHCLITHKRRAHDVQNTSGPKRTRDEVIRG